MSTPSTAPQAPNQQTQAPNQQTQAPNQQAPNQQAPNQQTQQNPQREGMAGGYPPKPEPAKVEPGNQEITHPDKGALEKDKHADVDRFLTEKVKTHSERPEKR